MMGIKVEGAPLKVSRSDDWFCTLFPDDPDEMPQDFGSWGETEAFGNDRYGAGNYTIESPC